MKWHFQHYKNPTRFETIQRFSHIFWPRSIFILYTFWLLSQSSSHEYNSADWTIFYFSGKKIVKWRCTILNCRRGVKQWSWKFTQRALCSGHNYFVENSYSRVVLLCFVSAPTKLSAFYVSSARANCKIVYLVFAGRTYTHAAWIQFSQPFARIRESGTFYIYINLKCAVNNNCSA